MPQTQSEPREIKSSILTKSFQHGEHYNKLRRILTQMFQLDQAELDFGIYRIMNQKRAEINDFLDNDLLTQIHETLTKSGSSSLEETKKNLQHLERTLKGAGVDVDTNEKVQELREEIARGGSTEALELEVYSRMTQFFKRYYKEGDFISQRRYKEGVYAIPYEGEEVKLYWANHDQYYIKTGEYFKNYSFRVRNTGTVHFTLQEADTEQDNKKEQQGKERRFQLHQDTIFEEIDGDLHIYFTYEPAEKKIKQDKLNDQALKTLSEVLPGKWTQELLQLKPTGKNKKRTLLEYRLSDYTAKNSFDYFIHKDLEGFLKRELDFYIKNEILHIDDIDLDDEQHFQKQLLLIKAMKKVAHKIIDFLAQIENFQKKLWLKKKMVLQSDYCITLDRMDEDFYEEIALNERQHKEWIDLFAIDELEDYTKEVSVVFLKNHPFLLLDTQFFSREFKYKLLSTIPHIDAQCEGLLVNSENFQALNLLQERYRGQVKCVYIDPPYNTGEDGFVYKDNFAKSSWLSFMYDRLLFLKQLIMEDGFLLSHIDENEVTNLELLLIKIFEESNLLDTIVWDKRNPKGDAKGIAVQHEFITIAAKNADLLTKESILRNKENAEIILHKAQSLISAEGEVNEKVRSAFKKWINKSGFSGGEKAYVWIDDNGEVFRPVSMSWPNKNKAPAEYFIPLVHPKTQKECPVPLRGWRNPPGTMKRLIDKGLILFGQDESTIPNRKYYLRENMSENLPSLLYDGRSNDSLFNDLDLEFDNPKPFQVSKKLLHPFTRENSITLDCFAGSGTTGHAVIEVNKDDNVNRKYILIDMAEYFNSTLKPRIQKVIYSDAWKNGKPTTREGSSHFFKYMRLESYEDTLNNLVLEKTDIDKEMREEYLLKYSLDIESRDSLLMLDAFRKPFGYTIKSTENNELIETEVDLVETFNYLIGLQVETMEIIRGYVVITGKTLDEKNVLVIWRDMDKHSNADLNAFCQKMKFNPLDYEWDRIYVNGDNNIENLKVGEERWKVKLIEHEFHQRMWEGSK